MKIFHRRKLRCIYMPYICACRVKFLKLHAHAYICTHQHEISGLDIPVLKACAVKIGCHLDARLCCKPVITGRQAEPTTLLQPKVPRIDTYGQVHRRRQ